MKPNKETYRILVIDDHPIVAEGIIALASQLEGVTCKGATLCKRRGTTDPQREIRPLHH